MILEQCPYCHMDTAGQHESDCPMNRSTIYSNTSTWTFIYSTNKQFNFCPNCGRKAKSEENYCPECGRKTKLEENFCPDCGRVLSEYTIPQQEDYFYPLNLHYDGDEFYHLY